MVMSYMRLHMLPDIKNLSKVKEKSSKNPSKIHQNSSKIDHKSIKICFWAPRSPKTLPRPLQAQKQEQFPYPFRLRFGRLCGPCSLQEPLNGHSKSIQNFDRFRYPFFIDFASILDAFWEGLGSHLGFQDAL